MKITKEVLVNLNASDKKLHWDAVESAKKLHWDAYKAAIKPHWDAYNKECAILFYRLFNEENKEQEK